MIIASGPYLSPHFVQTVTRNAWPVVDAGEATGYGLFGTDFRVTQSGEAVREIRSRPDVRLLTSGEHALDWVSRELAGTATDHAVRLFKDKARFRRLLQPLFPWLSFTELSLETLRNHVPDAADYPFVAKPSVGFFSIGVHIIRTAADWEKARELISAEVSSFRSIFPEHMLSQTHFLLESYIEGTEFAVDAYYDTAGQPVILNILEHRYAGPEDVSDRLYVSSKRIIETLEPQARKFLDDINGLAGIRNFPLHAEFRRDGSGNLVPIEVNPLRFGGWCTTGDFAHFAWGINPYELFMNGARPDWETVFAGREENEYGLIVLDNSTGIPGCKIRSFGYEALLQQFSRPLHLSRMDFSAFPLFGFLFVQTDPSSRAEFDWILESDLSEFVRTGPKRA
ncbi:MAG: ATP-grasp domain-containing protein [Xanthomonadales bacterium]|jgi:hypothetical protein|nr:ATP-grasp domain-containing protein [Xanthomonadales bacterium]